MRIHWAVSLAVLVAVPCQAAQIAFDDASQSAYDDGWQTGDNGGSGWGGGWTLSTSGANAGHFVGTSQNNGSGDGNIDTAGRAWGTYANSGDLADGVRPFNGALTAGQQFAIDMDNGFIQSGGTVGFGLQNSSGENRLEFFFVGGNAFYTIQDGSGHDSDVVFTSAGLSLLFTLTGADSYDFQINGGTPFSGTLGGTAGTGIDRVRVFNYNAGSGSNYDAFYNSMQIAVPEPSTAALCVLGLLALGLRQTRRCLVLI